MKIPVLIEFRALNATWLVLVLLLAGAAGYLLACTQLSRAQLEDAHGVLVSAIEDRRAAAEERATTRSTRERVEATLARAQAILDSAASEQRRQAERLEHGADAAEMPWL